MWATEIELGLQSSDASFALFHFLMDGVLDRDSGKYVLRREDSQNSADSGHAGSESKETVSGSEAKHNGSTADEGHLSATSNDSNAGLGQRSLVSEVGSLMDQVEGEQKQRRDEEKKNSRAPRIHDDNDNGGGNSVETRSYVILDIFHHPSLASQQYRNFFSACRRQGIAFDLEARSGLAFLLLDSFASGVLGAMAVGQSYHHALDSIFGCLNFILEQTGAPPRMRDDSTDIGIARVYEKVKQMRMNETARIQNAIKAKRLAEFAEKRNKSRSTALTFSEE
jgi:hypothetical protein